MMPTKFTPYKIHAMGLLGLMLLLLGTLPHAHALSCAPGSYDDGSSCVPADTGYYVPVADATEQTPCPIGRFQSNTGSVACSNAEAGHFVDVIGSAVQYACAPGFYQPSENAISCLMASPGYYVDTDGATEQIMCAAGYTSEAGATSCTLINANTAPTAVAGGPYLGAVNTSIAFDGSASSDPEGDSLAYTWDYGDGSTGTASSYSYSTADIYTVCLTVNDGALASEPNCTMVVVYDPAGSFVTGGGWFNSPAGALVANPSLTGKANFGFVSKYRRGANTPIGNTEFQLKAGSFTFHSSHYDWLVVNQNNTNAQFKGSGMVNDGLAPNGTEYKFQIWAKDSSPDTFRIKIWWDDNGVETLVYDNGSNQAIGGGNIQVH